jgi:hypothetical protein
VNFDRLQQIDDICCTYEIEEHRSGQVWRDFVHGSKWALHDRMAIVGLVLSKALPADRGDVELIAMRDPVSKVVDQLKDRRMVKVVVFHKFVIQRQKGTHCPGAKVFALETLIGSEQI